MLRAVEVAVGNLPMEPVVPCAGGVCAVDVVPEDVCVIGCDDVAVDAELNDDRLMGIVGIACPAAGEKARRDAVDPSMGTRQQIPRLKPFNPHASRPYCQASSLHCHSLQKA